MSRPHHKPRLNALLTALRLDQQYVRGSGAWLYYIDDRSGKPQRVLDLISGFGATLLGHAHPQLTSLAHKLLTDQRPQFVQGSRRDAAIQLAQKLSDRCGGDFQVVFGNSGTEAMEAAIKHAMLASDSNHFIALQGGFHGKTLGALQLTSNPDYRSPFHLPSLQVHRTPPNDPDALEHLFETLPTAAGLIYEPIQGEGGVRPLERPYLSRAAELCRERGIPLIADECQTGMGRCGHFLASSKSGITPDYVVLAKALGGGLSKISALLIQRKIYHTTFDLLHTSTFAEDEHSSMIASRAVDLIDDRQLAACRATGERLGQQLTSLADTFPDIIAEVRGVGLMWGIEFRCLINSTSFTIRTLSAQHDLLYLVSSYLLHRHHIRLAPTLSDPQTLRIQPTIQFDQADQQQLLDALEDVCWKLRTADARELVEHLAEASTEESQTGSPIYFRDTAQFVHDNPDQFHALNSSPAPDRRVAWLFHGIDDRDLVNQERSFGDWTADKRESLLERISVFANPIATGWTDIRSVDGEQVRVFPIMLPVTSRWMKLQIERREHRHATRLVQKGIEIARHLDCSLVSLGQYTSIVTANGRHVRDQDIGITTGNSYTVALVVQAIEEALAQRLADPSGLVLAIVGAAGNIGRACAESLSACFHHTLLFGSSRPGARTRLEILQRDLAGSQIADHPDQLRTAQVVVLASNSVDDRLAPAAFAPDAIVCDVSIPSGLSAELSLSRPDVYHIQGGLCRLPHGEHFGIRGFPLAAGLAYGCLAEGILLGLQGVRDSRFTGNITAENVAAVAGYAERFGFRAALDHRAPIEIRETTHVQRDD